MPSSSGALESILLRRSWISGHDLQRARLYRGQSRSLADSLIEIRVIEPRRLARALGEVFSLPTQFCLDHDALDAALLWRIGEQYARKNRILPLGSDGTRMIVASADPSNYQALDDLSTLFAMPAQPIVMPYDALERAIEHARSKPVNGSAIPQIFNLQDTSLEAAARDVQQACEIEIGADTPALVRLVGALLWRAVDERVQHIVIEPAEREVIVSFRTGEHLRSVLSAAASLQFAINSCLRKFAGSGIAGDESSGIRLFVGGRLLLAMLRSADGVWGERLTLDLPDPEPEFLDVIDRCEEALRQATESMLRLQPSVMCRACRAPVMVKHAFFCRHCGSRISYDLPVKLEAATFRVG